MAKTFVLHDESVNSHGFWMRTSGADLSQFQKNPIMLLNHNRGWRGTTDEVLPIGHWDNIRVEGDKIFADAVFDSDEFSQKVAQKVESGTLRMCSLGVRVIESSSDPIYVKPGQRYETVLKFKVREASIVDIGSNDNALALYDDNDNLTELSAGGENIPLNELTPNNNEMKELFELLKLQDGATEQDAINAIKPIQEENVQLSAALQKEQDQKKELQDRIDAIELAEKSEKKAAFEKELADAFKDGRLSEKADGSVKTKMLKLYDADPEATMEMLESMGKRKSVAANLSDTGDDKESAWEKRQKEIEANNKKR
jgi:hypothetical protein